MNPMEGVDLSSIGQGYLSPAAWDLINSVCNFVIIQASYGTVTDEQLANNQAQARRVQSAAGPLGIAWYHFAYPQFAVNTPQASAQKFLSAIGTVEPNEPLALDWEQPYGGDQVAWVLDFDDYIFAQIGKHLGWLYLNQSQESSIDWSPVAARGIKLWLAKYDGSKTAIATAVHWPNVSIKQWTNVDVVAGFSGKVDGDTFEGDINAWNAYGKASNPAPAVPAPAPAEPVAPAPAPSPPTDVPVSVPPSSPTPPAPAEPVSEPASPPVQPPTTTGLSDLEPEAAEIVAAVKKVDPLSKLPQPILVKIQEDEQKVSSWLATGTAKTLLKLVGAAAGWYLSNPNLLHIPALGPTVIGAILAGAFADLKQK